MPDLQLCCYIQVSLNFKKCIYVFTQMSQRGNLQGETVLNVRERKTDIERHRGLP